MTALPRSPGWGPSPYQPTSSQGFCVGTARSPSDRMPTISTNALTPTAGTTRRIGSVFVFPGCVAVAITVGVTVLPSFACSVCGCGVSATVLLHALSMSITMSANTQNGNRTMRINCTPFLLTLLLTLYSDRRERLRHLVTAAMCDTQQSTS